MDVTGWGKFLVLLGSALGLVAYRFWHRCLLCDPEFAAGPFYHGLCLRIKLHAGVADRAVVIAQDGNGSLCDEVDHGRYRPIGLGAVTDIVAEKYKLFGA